MGTLYPFTFTYGNFSFDAAIDDDKNGYISYRSIENALNWRPNSTREKLASNALSNHCNSFGVSISQLGKNKVLGKGNSLKSFVLLSEFVSVIVPWQVEEQNNKAKQLMYSGFAADFSKVFYEAVGIELDKEKLDYLRTLNLPAPETRDFSLFLWVKNAS